jgi:hypothetical protein
MQVSAGDAVRTCYVWGEGRRFQLGAGVPGGMAAGAAAKGPCPAVGQPRAPLNASLQVQVRTRGGGQGRRAWGRACARALRPAVSLPSVWGGGGLAPQNKGECASPTVGFGVVQGGSWRKTAATEDSSGRGLAREGSRRRAKGAAAGTARAQLGAIEGLQVPGCRGGRAQGGICGSSPIRGRCSPAAGRIAGQRQPGQAQGCYVLAVGERVG